MSKRSEPADRSLGDVLEFMRTLWALDHGLQLRSKRMERHLGITGPQRLVLRIVGRFPGISAGEVASIMEVHPSTLTGVLPDMKVCNTEVFGPVVGVAVYDDWHEALRLANDTRYGLQAGVFTRDVGRALEAGRVLDFGGVLVNEVPTFRTDQMPYGGVRDSGNTKEGPHFAVREMTRERLVLIQR